MLMTGLNAAVYHYERHGLMHHSAPGAPATCLQAATHTLCSSCLVFLATTHFKRLTCAPYCPHTLQFRLGALATETAALREDNEVLTRLLVETKVQHAETQSECGRKCGGNGARRSLPTMAL